MSLRAWEIAMGMRDYSGSSAEREDRAELKRLEAIAVAAHNACHDWLIAHPDENRAPADLAIVLFDAEEAVRACKQRLADLAFHRGDMAELRELNRKS